MGGKGKRIRLSGGNNKKQNGKKKIKIILEPRGRGIAKYMRRTRLLRGTGEKS